MFWSVALGVGGSRYNQIWDFGMNFAPRFDQLKLAQSAQNATSGRLYKSISNCPSNFGYQNQEEIHETVICTAIVLLSSIFLPPLTQRYFVMVISPDQSGHMISDQNDRGMPES